MKGDGMRYEVCLEKMQMAWMAVELPDDANHDQIYQAAMQQPHNWEDHGNPDIHDVIEYRSYEDEEANTPS
jgi:hypothetical protein